MFPHRGGPPALRTGPERYEWYFTRNFVLGIECGTFLSDNIYELAGKRCALPSSGDRETASRLSVAVGHMAQVDKLLGRSGCRGVLADEDDHVVVVVVGAKDDGESAAWAQGARGGAKERTGRAEAERTEDGQAYVGCRGRHAGEDGGCVSEDEGKVAEMPVLLASAGDLCGVAVDTDADGVPYADEMREIAA